ncbi:hypothetical protein D3C71_1450810 [compost metagenome]
MEILADRYIIADKKRPITVTFGAQSRENAHPLTNVNSPRTQQKRWRPNITQPSESREDELVGNRSYRPEKFIKIMHHASIHLSGTLWHTHRHQRSAWHPSHEQVVDKMVPVLICTLPPYRDDKIQIDSASDKQR